MDVGGGLRRGEIESEREEQADGVAWWTNQLRDVARAIISDHLVQCIVSVEGNLVEARLHELKLLDWAERYAHFVAQPHP